MKNNFEKQLKKEREKLDALVEEAIENAADVCETRFVNQNNKKPFLTR